VAAGRPTTPHLGLRPLTLSQDATGCGGDEFVFLLADVFQSLIDGGGNLVGRVPGHVFTQSRTEYFASRSLGATGKTLDLLEYLVRDGNRRFHTRSITVSQGSVSASRRSALKSPEGDMAPARLPAPERIYVFAVVITSSTPILAKASPDAARPACTQDGPG